MKNFEERLESKKKHVKILKRARGAKEKRRGRKSKTSLEDKLKMSLEYWRE